MKKGVRRLFGRKAEDKESGSTSPATSAPTEYRKIFPSGIKLFYDSKNSVVDIIFVHGLTGDREKTWTAKGAAKPWPQDLLPTEIANARILTFGYDAYVTSWKGMVSKNTIGNHSMNMLSTIATYRDKDDTNNRPIIFVCHSLGGLVCEDALVQARQTAEGHLRNILDSTRGIIFMGTPHRGSGLAEWAEKLAKSIGLLKQTNPRIVAVLEQDSEVLARIQHSFHAMIRSRSKDGLSPIEITCFYEEMPLLGVGVVVPEYSASLPGYTPIGIHSNHMDMTKFVTKLETGEDDPGFLLVAGELRRWIKVVTQEQQRNQPQSLSSPSQSSLLKDQRQKLLASLNFEQIDVRQMTIGNAHSKTCEWLLNNSEYLNWLDDARQDEHHGFLWIKGKPGTGKSTIMKFALANARKTMRNRVVMSFFFNARGADLEKSTVGAYRSLLLQLFKRIPTLQCDLDLLGLSASDFKEDHRWEVEPLKTLLEEAIRNLEGSSVVCFIDALDECEEDEIRDMVAFFQQVGVLAAPAKKLHVCFSSRHYPHITIRKGLHLVLENQYGHDQDIANYLDNELVIGGTEVAQQIKTKLQEKASGVFMWVVLVAGILNKEHDRGHMHMLQQRLQELPSDLYELFRDILGRNTDNRAELLLCIQWVLFAARPLSPEELYLAILSGTKPESLSGWNSNKITADTIIRFILDTSKGLAEVTTNQSPRVQFIHESVRDFLLKPETLESIWPGIRSCYRGQSHERLKSCCLTYAKMQDFEYVSNERFAKIRQKANSAFPFLGYSTINILHHSIEAGSDGISQETFLQSFAFDTWIRYFGPYLTCTCGTQSDDVGGLSLNQILSKDFAKRLTRSQRYFTALCVAYSALQLVRRHGTGFTKDDILFFPCTFDRCNVSIHGPFIRRSFRHDHPSIANNEAIDGNFFWLGILLLELAFGQRLEDHPFRRKYSTETGDFKRALDTMTALHWSRDLEDEVGYDYSFVVKWCFKPVNFSNQSSQHEVLRNVVQPLVLSLTYFMDFR